MCILTAADLSKKKPRVSRISKQKAGFSLQKKTDGKETYGNLRCVYVYLYRDFAFHEPDGIKR